MKKVLRGVVVSDRMAKTRVVVSETLVKHPIVKKYVRHKTKCYAHDEENKTKTGDIVEITECRPISRLKRWQITNIVKA